MHFSTGFGAFTLPLGKERKEKERVHFIHSPGLDGVFLPNSCMIRSPFSAAFPFHLRGYLYIKAPYIAFAQS